MAVLQRYVGSHAQRGLWFLQRQVPESVAYNLVSAWRIRSRVDDGALAAALVEMANRHDALRTTSRERDGVVWAEVNDRVDALRLVDARGANNTELMRQLSDEADRPFDLQHGSVFRPKLFTISHDDHVLALMAHQIVADGWSLRIFMKELGLLYGLEVRTGIDGCTDTPMMLSDPVHIRTLADLLRPYLAHLPRRSGEASVDTDEGTRR